MTHPAGETSAAIPHRHPVGISISGQSEELELFSAELELGACGSDEELDPGVLDPSELELDSSSEEELDESLSGGCDAELLLGPPPPPPEVLDGHGNSLSSMNPPGQLVSGSGLQSPGPVFDMNSWFPVWSGSMGMIGVS